MGDVAYNAAVAWLEARVLHCELAYNTQLRFYTPAYLRSARKGALPRVASFWDFLSEQGWKVCLQCTRAAPTYS